MNATTSVFEVEGELSFVTVPNILERGRFFIAEQQNPVFDLKKVTFCDNAGVALLISWVRFAKKSAKQVKFINIPEQISELIIVGGLEEVLPVA